MHRGDEQAIQVLLDGEEIHQRVWQATSAMVTRFMNDTPTNLLTDVPASLPEDKPTKAMLEFMDGMLKK